MNANDKLILLRQQLSAHGIDAYLQPVHDEFMSEYPPEAAQRVRWLCGFSGSAGMAAATASAAALFVDGRYTLQAANEVDGGLYSIHNSGDTSPESWLAGQSVKKVGYDPFLFTPAMLARLEKALVKSGIQLLPIANPIDAIWRDRPVMPASRAEIYPLRYAGQESAEKRTQVAKAVVQAGADAALLVAPDSVCWLLNIRGRDIENTPFLLALALLDKSGAVALCIDPARVDADVRVHMGEAVTLIAPEAWPQKLAQLGREGRKVLCDSQSVPVAHLQQLQGAGAGIVEGTDPCQLPKACKNKTQIDAIREAHRHDGAAVIRLLCWLEAQAIRRDVSEMEVAETLLSMRREQPDFVEPSFPTIAGSGPHGAIVHYRANAATNRVLKPGELFLLDSGGQYRGGTTDITRTVAIGQPGGEHKDRFTRVLKGHIALAMAQFPEGVTGTQLDSLARQFLWQAGLDYDHGTGHGVGQYLSVHEGPQRISKRGGDVALAPGMVLSNEPGYYKAGEYGIRIENLVVVSPKSAADSGKRFLGFETLTCVPIDTRLVEASMLSADERLWLNAYHAWVQEKQLPGLSGEALLWLEERCKPVH